MKKCNASSYIKNLLPILLVTSFFAGLIFLFNAAKPVFAFSGDYALEFDGQDDFVLLPETSAIFNGNWESTKTVSLWLYPQGPARVCGEYTDPFTPINDPAKCDHIFGDKPRWWGISRGIMNGNDRIRIWNYDGNYDIIDIEYSADQWIHIALVHDGGTLTAYKNGVEISSIASGDTGQPPPPATPDIQLGGVINNAERRWLYHGKIDEVRIWDVALSADQIRQNMYRELTGSETGLAAYYKMSDGAGTTLTDDSGNGHGGALSSGGSGVPADLPPIWVTSGAFAGPRNALDFDGSNDYVSVPADISMPANLTLEAWVYPRDTSGGQKWIAGEVNGAQLTIDGTQAQFRIFDGTLQGPATAILAANEWQHIAGTYDGSDLRIYINGVEGTSASFSGSNVDQDGIFAIGSPDGTAQLNNIIVDEVRLWSQAHDRSQIRNNMHQTLQGNESGLTAYYRFDQDAASGSTTLYNLASNGNHGTLTNMDPATDWVASTAFNTWIGSDSSDWAAGENWSRYAAPAASDHVGIQNYPGSYAPVIGSAISVDNLTVAAGGSLTVNGSGSLGIAGSLFNHGTLTQIQNIDGSSTVDYFNTGNYGGLTIDPESQNLGDTTVVIRGVQNCTTTLGETVERCFDISPSSSPVSSTTLTFFFDSSELSGNTCNNLDAFHWDSGSWNLLILDTGYGTLGRDCLSDPNSIQVTGVTGFSPFVLKENVPNAVVIESFSGKTLSLSLVWVAGILILAILPIGIIAKKQIKR